MDRKITPQNRPFRKLTLIVSAVSLVIVFVYLLGSSSKVYVDSELLIIKKATNRDFQELIALDGAVLPIKSVIMDALIGGKVAEIFARDGDLLTNAQPILRLENTDLQLDILNKETAVFDLLNNIQNTHNLLAQTLVNRHEQLADINYNLQESERQFNLNKILVEKEGISQQTFIQSKNTFSYYLRKKTLIEQALKQDSLSALEQIKQMKESVMRAKQNLSLMQEKLDDLIIQSPIEGQLSSFDYEIGQLVNKGDNIGQIDVLTAYKIKIQIDERHISRVFEGSTGKLVLDGNSFTLSIKHVYPTVLNNEFTADMVFTENLPDNLKRGQNVVVRLELSEVKKALLLPKGGFFQSSGGNFVYVVSSDGDKAVKRPIKIGRQNPDYYEIVEGLENDENVIISNYESFIEHDIIYLN